MEKGNEWQKSRRAGKSMADAMSEHRIVSDEAIALVLRLKTMTVQDLVRMVSRIRSKMEQARTLADVEEIENDILELEDAYRAKAYMADRLFHRMIAVKVDLLPKPKGVQDEEEKEEP